MPAPQPELEQNLCVEGQGAPSDDEVCALNLRCSKGLWISIALVFVSLCLGCTPSAQQEAPREVRALDMFDSSVEFHRDSRKDMDSDMDFSENQNTEVYFLHEGELQRLSYPTDPRPRTLATAHEQASMGLGVDDHGVYWIAADDSGRLEVIRYSHDTGSVARIPVPGMQEPPRSFDDEPFELMASSVREAWIADSRGAMGRILRFNFDTGRVIEESKFRPDKPIGFSRLDHGGLAVRLTDRGAEAFHWTPEDGAGAARPINVFNSRVDLSLDSDCREESDVSPSIQLDANPDGSLAHLRLQSVSFKTSDGSCTSPFGIHGLLDAGDQGFTFHHVPEPAQILGHVPAGLLWTRETAVGWQTELVREPEQDPQNLEPDFQPGSVVAGDVDGDMWLSFQVRPSELGVGPADGVLAVVPNLSTINEYSEVWRWEAQGSPGDPLFLGARVVEE